MHHKAFIVYHKATTNINATKPNITTDKGGVKIDSDRKLSSAILRDMELEVTFPRLPITSWRYNTISTRGTNICTREVGIPGIRRAAALWIMATSEAFQSL